MTQLLVEVPEDRANSVQEWLGEQGLDFVVQEEIPAEIRQMLDARLTQFEKDGVAQSWEEVREELRNL